jgi:hypothetical protein
MCAEGVAAIQSCSVGRVRFVMGYRKEEEMKLHVLRILSFIIMRIMRMRNV